MYLLRYGKTLVYPGILLLMMESNCWEYPWTKSGRLMSYNIMGNTNIIETYFASICNFFFTEFIPIWAVPWRMQLFISTDKSSGFHPVSWKPSAISPWTIIHSKNRNASWSLDTGLLMITVLVLISTLDLRLMLYQKKK